MAVGNVAMLLTGPGLAAIAVVRLRGPNTGEFLRRRFSRPVALGRCVHGELRDGAGTVVDDAVAVMVDANTADLNLHGGAYVVRAVLEMCRADGFAVIDRVELPLDDLAVDGSDLVETEMLQHLPRARTELALRVMLAQPPAWRRLTERINRAEVGAAELGQILEDQSLQWLLRLPRVAIVGPANVGKSTLANRLFGQERSITADVPGTTRDWVGEVANLDGLAVMLIDTPGQRAAGELVDPIERAALSASEPAVAGADVVVVVLDASAAIPVEGRALLAEHPGAVVVGNKADRGLLWEVEEVIRTVGTTGQGLAVLVQRILARFDCAGIRVDVPRCWTERQRGLLRQRINPVH